MIKVSFKSMIAVKIGNGEIAECLHLYCKGLNFSKTDLMMYSVHLKDDTLHIYNSYFWNAIQSIEHVKPTDL